MNSCDCSIKYLHDKNAFVESIANKLLRMGIIVYGGYPRDIIRRKGTLINLKKRNFELNGLKFFNPVSDPDTKYIRCKPINDIDCIANTYQYETLNIFASNKINDIELFVIQEVNDKYMLSPIKEVDIYIKHIKLKLCNTIQYSSKFSVLIDLLICSPNKEFNILEHVTKNCDYNCNKLYMQIYNDSIFTSVKCNNSMDEYLSIIDQINNGIATKTDMLADNSSLTRRMYKMLCYGWIIQVGYHTCYNVDIIMNDNKCIDNLVYIYAKKQETEICNICMNKRRPIEVLTVRNRINVKVNNMHYHLRCYIDKSVKYYNYLHDLEFTPSDELMLNVTETTPNIIDDIMGTIEEETNDEEFSHKPKEDIRSDISDIDELNIFIENTKKKDTDLQNIIYTTDEPIVINDVLFIDGVAQGTVSEFAEPIPDEEEEDYDKYGILCINTTTIQRLYNIYRYTNSRHVMVYT